MCACWGGVRLLNGELDNYTFDTAAGEDKTRLTAFRFISNVAKIVIICIGALLVLELLGYSATRIFAALGIGGVAVAFACKDAVENLISGFIIVFNKPFRVGDFITVGELSGTVEDIAVRSTTCERWTQPLCAAQYSPDQSEHYQLCGYGKATDRPNFHLAL